MGMFDTIYIEDKIINKLNEFFKDDSLPLDMDWQTKDLENCMYSYHLKSPNPNEFEPDYKLYFLDAVNKDDPLSAPFWTAYTDEEIAEHNNEKTKFFWMPKEKGDGHFSNEAFAVKNRRHRDMGELPHQIIRAYTSERHINEFSPGEKETKWFELLLKFTDGVLVGVKRQWQDKDFKLTKESEWLKV